MTELLVNTPRGLYCAQGDFYIDPWQPVERAIITHAHSDHARPDSKYYLSTKASLPILKQRLGQESFVETLAYGEQKRMGDVTVSLHPAGHIMGSSQVRIEHKGEVWVASGDYKMQPDPTCEAFESVRCHTFITEATFALPIYRWQPMTEVAEEIKLWWTKNQAQNRTSIVFAYALGKSQRILSELSPDQGPIFVTAAVQNVTEIYRANRIPLPPTQLAEVEPVLAANGKGIIIAPPSLAEGAWLKKFPNASTAFASGWMRVRGQRRRQNLDRGFVISDHADWPGLLQAVESSGAERIIVTHGSTEIFARWLNEKGKQAGTFQTQFEGEVST